MSQGFQGPDFTSLQINWVYIKVCRPSTILYRVTGYTPPWQTSPCMNISSFWSSLTLTAALCSQYWFLRNCFWRMWKNAEHEKKNSCSASSKVLQSRQNRYTHLSVDLYISSPHNWEPKHYIPHTNLLEAKVLVAWVYFIFLSYLMKTFIFDSTVNAHNWSHLSDYIYLRCIFQNWNGNGF